ncbi:MAG: hypothetical protein JXB18_04125 [Sedimentisphaerales bacterium]|nr:hypothetical protein [Sedimentisphaerales bacterium]
MKYPYGSMQIISISLCILVLTQLSAKGDLEQRSSDNFELFDIANQAYLVTWDIHSPVASHPRRTEQLEIDDLFFDRFIFPRQDGTYMLPTMPTTGQGVIGFQWYDKRFVSQLYIEFANPKNIPADNKVRLEYWIGDSVFEGQWVPLPGRLIKKNNGLRYIIADKDCKAATEGTSKIRWCFTEAIPAYIFIKLQALTHFQWQNTVLNIEFEAENNNLIPIQLYNTQVAESQNKTDILWLDPSKDNVLKLRYCLSGARNAERSIVTFDLSDYPFAVAIDEVVDKGCIYVKELGVFIATADSGMTLDAYKTQIHSRQTTLEMIRRMPDQTFADVMAKAHPSIQDDGPAMLSLACDNNKFILRQDGSIRYLQNLEAPPSHRKSERGHTDEFRNDIIELIPYFGSLSPSLSSRRDWPWFSSEKYPNQTRSLEDSYYPAPLHIIRVDGITYKQKTFVAPSGKPVVNDNTGFYNTQPLLVSKFTIENPSNKTQSTSLKFQLIDDIRNNTSPAIRRISAGYIAFAQSRLLAFIDTTGLKSLSADLINNQIIITGELPPNSRRECVAFIPAWHAETEQLDDFKNDSQLFVKMKTYWDTFLTLGATLELPDSQLTNLIKASIINCTITARNECNYTKIAPWISATHFGVIESESQSIIEGMSLMGHEQFARNALDFFIRRYNNDGMLTSGYTLMGQGWHMRVLGQYYMLYHNDSWLRNNQSDISSACDWIIKQHEKTKMVTPAGEKVIEYGLMPPGTTADWSLLQYNIRLQAEFYAGLNAAAKALKQVNHSKADDYLEKARELQSDIFSSYRRTQRRCPVIPLSNGTWIPYCPTVAAQFGSMAEKIGKAFAAKDVSMGAQHLVVLGVLPPDAKDGYFKANRFEDYDFQLPCSDFPANKIKQDWFNYAGFYRGQPYYPRITDVYALNDDVKPFIRSYFNNIMPIVNTEILTFWEHFRASGGWNKTHETGWFLQQTRMMLVNEKAKTLWLAPFVPNNWMQNGMKVAAQNLPTTFGLVSFTLDSYADKGMIKAIITPPTRSKPESIIIRLRHPQQKPVQSVTINGSPHDNFDPAREIIRIDSMPQTITVEAYY